MRSKFNDKQIKTLLDNLVIVSDTREQKNHVQEWLKSKNKMRVQEIGLRRLFLLYRIQ